MKEKTYTTLIAKTATTMSMGTTKIRVPKTALAAKTALFDLVEWSEGCDKGVRTSDEEGPLESSALAVS
jgi:hypothetical protein